MKKSVIQSKVISSTSYEQIIKSKLVEAGLSTPRLITLSTATDLANRLRVSVREADAIVAWSSKKLEESGVTTKSFSTAEELYKKQLLKSKLSTGCKSLDNILGGGIESGVITEFYGGNGSGKTQVCYSLCVMIQQSTQVGGLEGKAIYIDTENKFTPARLKEISEAKKFDVENILKNVIANSSHNILRQEEDIENIDAICEKDKKIKLVVVDSIINHYRHELGGRNNLSERQHRLIKSITLLERIARFFDIAVVITNQVSSIPDEFTPNAHIPLGGNVLAHLSKHRLSLIRSGRNIIAKVITSSSLPSIDARVTINESGMCEVD